MRIDVFSDFNLELEKIWCDFETEAFLSPFQSYAWLSLWQNTVGFPLHSIQPQLVVVRRGKETLALFPMGMRKAMGVSVLEWLGGQHSDYLGPLLSDKWKDLEKDFQACWQKIIFKLIPFDVIHLQKQEEYIGALRNPFVQSMSCSRNILSYRTNLNSTWKEHYEKKVKNKLRSDSRRQRRRLAENGELKFLVAKEQNTKKNIIDNMISQKSRRYRDTKVSDMLSIPEHKKFYEKLANIPEKTLEVHCSALYVGKTIVATHVGLVDQSIFYYLMPAHEGGDWERYSPGRLLLEHLIEWSIKRQLKIFDFTVGIERYKKDWCDKETQLFETLEPVTFKGKMYSVAQHAKYAVKQKPWLGKHVKKLSVWLRNRK